MSLDAIEMDDLSRRPRSTSTELRPKDDGNATFAGNGSITIWAWTSAIVLALFSICLLVFPRFLLFLAEPTRGQGTLTSLEKYLALQLGVIFGIVAVTIIAALPNEWPTGLQQRTDPNWHPLLRPVTAASVVMALLSYDNGTVGTLTRIVFFGSSIVGLFGLWMLVFSGPPAVSSKTGADKHTSSFIFGNKSAASFQKKLWKRNQSK